MEGSKMELSHSIRTAMRRAAEQALAEERRSDGRLAVSCGVTICWHHEPDHAFTYEGVDLSESGLRISSPTILPEGMTGRAAFEVGSVSFNNSTVVSWCRAIRDAGGRIDRWEAGLRLL
ncbi:MAG: hypothetical protein EXS15_02970 [Phycisphaerales bacterium]|nr:hypothetical protein [Phycisphaerales bacterium]